MRAPRARLQGPNAGRWKRPTRLYPALASRASSSRPLFLADGRVAGHLTLWRGRVALVKQVVGSRHMLRRPPAWAVDEGVLQEAQAAGAELVVVRDSESGAVYHAPLARFIAEAFLLDRGCGRQFALPLARWVARRPGQTSLFEFQECHNEQLHQSLAR